ncbi:uncharacterized protein LOC119741679 [Patiria miniata]|uniref:Methyltransferase type 11 domain-containing protein n=1 Tax=Patiria miniata TaxID=46514 RepID=A0A914BC86_PATMI|nr:uncharacterized protein LOC119741679 [Patiria miniata]
MDRVVKTKLAFVVSLHVKHSKEGVRSTTNRLAMEHFDKLNCSPDDHVLYVGYGDEAVILATRVNSVVVIDVDPALLEIGKSDRPADNVEYLQDDLGEGSPHLANWGESFSQVVSIGRVMFYPNVPLVLRNMVGCLKPGGQLLCVIPNNDFNFFGGAAKVIEDHPEWGQRVKKSNLTLWNHTEEQAEEFFQGICDWSELSCKSQRVYHGLPEQKAKLILLDTLDQVGSSHQEECLKALWQWALNEYGCTEDGCLKKPSEYMVIYGVKRT